MVPRNLYLHYLPLFHFIYTWYIILFFATFLEHTYTKLEILAKFILSSILQALQYKLH